MLCTLWVQVDPIQSDIFQTISYATLLSDLEVDVGIPVGYPTIGIPGAVQLKAYLAAHEAHKDQAYMEAADVPATLSPRVQSKAIQRILGNLGFP